MNNPFKSYAVNHDSTISAMFTVEDLPYLYQSEYVTNARSHVHRGFFVEPTGRKFKYTNPEHWRSDTHNIGNPNPPVPLTPRQDFPTSYISPVDLFENLKSCKPKFTFSKLLGKDKLDADLLLELLKSTVRGHENAFTDTGRWTNALYIYVAESDVYQKVILSERGTHETFNIHPDVPRIVSAFGQVGGRPF